VRERVGDGDHTAHGVELLVDVIAVGIDQIAEGGPSAPAARAGGGSSAEPRAVGVGPDPAGGVGHPGDPAGEVVLVARDVAARVGAGDDIARRVVGGAGGDAASQPGPRRQDAGRGVLATDSPGQAQTVSPPRSGPKQTSGPFVLPFKVVQLDAEGLLPMLTPTALAA